MRADYAMRYYVNTDEGMQELQIFDGTVGIEAAFYIPAEVGRFSKPS